MNMSIKNDESDEIVKEKQKRNIRKYFSNSMIVIDEVHNIRISTSINKQSSMNILKLFNYMQNTKLLLLTATPMFNNYTEIIWLANLLNLNDNRSPIKFKDVFNADGSFCYKRWF